MWLVFLFLDLTGMADSTWIKFAAICLCAAAAWTGADSDDGKLVAAALTLTVCADVFLLVLNRNDVDQVVGVGLFLAVQLLYAYRLYLWRGARPSRMGRAVRVVCLFLSLTVLGATTLFLAFFIIGFGNTPHSLPQMLLFAFGNGFLIAAGPILPLVYFVNLCVNCAEAFALGAPLRRFAWGLLLFIGCDICVGCWNLELLGDFARVGMWLFYLPSQVLIVLSQTTKGDPLP